jgi:hypothetical protein
MDDDMAIFMQQAMKYKNFGCPDVETWMKNMKSGKNMKRSEVVRSCTHGGPSKWKCAEFAWFQEAMHLLNIVELLVAEKLGVPMSIMGLAGSRARGRFDSPRLVKLVRGRAFSLSTLFYCIIVTILL